MPVFTIRMDVKDPAISELVQIVVRVERETQAEAEKYAAKKYPFYRIVFTLRVDEKAWHGKKGE